MLNLYELQDVPNLIYNPKVYGLQNSLRVSGFPMQTQSIEEEESRLIGRGKRLGTKQSNSGEDNYLCGVIVQFDLDVSIKMWTEFERYHFADIISSQSTMHRALMLEEDRIYGMTTKETIESFVKAREQYKKNPSPESYLTLLYSIPVGMKLVAGVTTNYRQLKVMYEQRKNHRLPEWREFCKWVLTLPKFKELTGLGDE